MWQIPFRLCSTAPDNAPALRSRTLENNIIYLHMPDNILDVRVVFCIRNHQICSGAKVLSR